MQQLSTTNKLALELVKILQGQTYYVAKTAIQEAKKIIKQTAKLIEPALDLPGSDS